jgi:porphobilinogen deaminase
MNNRPLRIGMRSSILARWQADHVMAMLRSADPTVEIPIITCYEIFHRRKSIRA